MAVTMQDIADMAGVSRPVVSAVLNGNSKLKVAPATRTRIMDLVHKTGYIKNLSACMLNGQSSRSIAVFINPDYLPIYRDLQYQLTLHLTACGYKVLQFPLITPKTEAEIMRDALQFGIDGIISVDCGNMVSQQELQKPMVTLMRDAFAVDAGIDHQYGGYTITKHLLEHGHRKICLIGPSLSAQAQKVAGFRGACEEFGVPLENSQLLDLTWNIRFAEQLERLIRHDGVTGFVASSDYIAVRLIGYLTGRGIKVPDDIAVTGYDGDMYACSGACRITTMRQPMTELARTGVEILMDKIKHERHEPVAEPVLLKASLHLGDSCGCSTPPEKTICWERVFATLEGAECLIKIPPSELTERYQHFNPGTPGKTF